MHDPAIFNFHPSSLVRMSKDDIIDQYKIYPIKIGEGNDAVVYKAKQNFNGGQWRAVKKIHRSYIDKEEYLLTEIQILKRLDHPGVLKIFQVFDDSEYVSIVSQLCEGNSLLQELKKRGHFTEKDAKQIFRKLIQVISYCHQNKIIHRDLKLENLVYCTQNSTADNLRLIDFGMAYEWRQNARQEIKSTFESNKIVGTIYYMAPQIRHETYDHRVDIWSCGVILYALLTGELPFNSECDQDIIECIKQRRVCYEKLVKRKCSNQVIELLTKIFVSQNKRISIQEIIDHCWLKQQTYNSNQQSLSYYSQIAYKQFFNREEFYQYYNEQIKQLSSNDKNQSSTNPSHQLLINWNNVCQFLKLDQIEKAIKIYLTNRLSQKKSHSYRGIFDYFKAYKKESVLMGDLYDHLYEQYQHLLLSQLQVHGHSQNLIHDKHNHNHQNRKRQLSIKRDEQQIIYSAKLVYQQLLTFFQHNKYRTIGYTMFLTWVCDYDDFDKSELNFLRSKLRNKTYEQRSSNKRAVINDEIMNIHKIIRNSYLQKKTKSRSQFSHQTTQQSSKASLRINSRNIPQLKINVDRIKQENQMLSTKRTSKKSVKQNILQSISPTFIRRKNHSQSNVVKTQRPVKGSRYLKNGDNNNGGFGLFMGIQKIMSFL